NGVSQRTVTHADLVNLIEDKQPAPCFVKMHDRVMRWVRCKTEVQTAFDSVKRLNLVVADSTNCKILEYLATGADVFSQIFMQVGQLISLSQRLSFNKKLLPEPLSR